MRLASCDRSSGMASPVPSPSGFPSAGIRLPGRQYEIGSDDIGHGQRFDAGHLPEPDFLAAGKTRRVDRTIIVGDFLERGNLEDISLARSAPNKRFDRVADLFGRMRLDPLRRAPQGGGKRLYFGR